MMPGMWLREEDSDPLAPVRGVCRGLLFSVLFWAIVGFCVGYYWWTRP